MIVPVNHPRVLENENAPMAIQAAVYCPHCDQALRVPLSASGKNARCRCCQGRFVIPEAARLVDDTMAYFMSQTLDHHEHGYAVA